MVGCQLDSDDEEAAVKEVCKRIQIDPQLPGPTHSADRPIIHTVDRAVELTELGAHMALQLSCGIGRQSGSASVGSGLPARDADGD